MKRNRLLICLLVCGEAISTIASGEVPAEAMRLRNSGIAELENEQPSRAEETFTNLAQIAPKDPLPWANLAVALLRQQKFEEAEQALARARKIDPEDPDLRAIGAEILQWSGRPDESLELLRQAASDAPDTVALQYALWRQASSLSGPESEAAKAEAIGRLSQLRPDNLLVLLQRGQLAIGAADRSAASEAFLRVRELMWLTPGPAETLLNQILEALDKGDVPEARVPSLRLENVLKITPMYKEGLRELSPQIQGIPLLRFRDEPPTVNFGAPVDVKFVSTKVADGPTVGKGLTVGDLDGDGRTDWARLSGASPGRIEIHSGQTGEIRSINLARPGASRLVNADLDNDGRLDLLVFGPGVFDVYRNGENDSYELATDQFGLAKIGATAAAPLDFDIEGDIDLAIATGSSPPLEILLNTLDGPLRAVGDHSLPNLGFEAVADLIATDLDRDGDVDLLVAHDGGLTFLDNLRQGSFGDHTVEVGLAELGRVQAVASADFDNDGMPDLVTAGEGIQFWRNRMGRFEPWALGASLRTSARFDSLVPFDADNDGRLDLAIAGPEGLAIVSQHPDKGLQFVAIDSPPQDVEVLAVGDVDGDCDQDLIAGSATGLFTLENRGGDSNRCLEVRLVGLDKGNSKNNSFGLGATIELRSGQAYQFREVTRDTTHLGLGSITTPDLLRVVWSNGVPQNRLQPETNQRIVEEQVVKGSCPFLYAWNGNEFEFVTDLLWGAPAGLPVAPGVWATADPEELVEVRNAVDRAGHYEIRITEELWEAAFFDFSRLWVVDHPETVEVTSSLRIVPGRTIEEKVHGTRDLQPVSAWGSNGEEITASIRERDEVYADVWEPSRYQGVAAAPWFIEFDLGEAPNSPIRLILDGWVFPSDASLNVAVGQRSDLSTAPPRLEALVDGEWLLWIEEMGFPAGKTKSMLVDVPELPGGVRRLRMIATQWLSFDRIVWSKQPADHEPVVVDRLLPTEATLQYRGFSRLYRNSPNGPHLFDYQTTDPTSPWLPFPGRYTRYGDVRELLLDPDDRSVVMAPGDEMIVKFDISRLPSPRPGWRRTVFLESHGWDKDADRNTWEAQQVAPLPFRSMTGYPFGDGDEPPSGEVYEEYLRDWLTREVEPVQGILPSRTP